ncbi:MAG: Eco57I restriction-modification methylase domain-containing protein [Candidatus Binatia bacterium]
MGFRNQNLFSANYLVRRLPETTPWRDATPKAEKAFGEVKAAYERIRGLKLGVGEEANLEDKFIRPVMKALEFDYDVQPVTQRGPRKKRPDYALFASHKELKEAKKQKGNLKRFFSHALTIAEAKYWGRALNDTDRKDTLDSRDPTAQLIKYLEDVHHHSDGKILWGVLTNGKVWRLFYHRAASRSGNFYEADLEEIIRSGDINSFNYFYLFFAKDAFVQDTRTGKSWLDQHLEGSGTYAKEVSEKLKDRIFDQVFEHLAEGFLEHRRVERGLTAENQDTLQQVFNGCLTLLYRLLFLLYAESRELLPVQDQHRYYRNSLRKLQRDIVADLQTVGLEGMSHRAFNYWARLESLCRIIDKGDRTLNVPIYNGGLFQFTVADEDKRPEADAVRFVRDHKLADPYLAKAIVLLTVDEPDNIKQDQVQFIDYSSLGVRHLGDIYEGLLEFRVRIVGEEVFEVREKGKLVWKRAQEVKGAKTYRHKRAGEVYIENSRHERRATGSFYTPHYIVEYIVKHTVGPVLEERLHAVRKLLEEMPRLETERKKAPAKARPVAGLRIESKKQEVFETLFSPRILDPAMGSGHFLVHAVDFIADRLVAFLADFPDNPVIGRIEGMRQQILEDVKRQGVEIDASKLTEINLIKRMVMKRCIYGVDLNPMAVELAKLSLWLDSFTLGAPLSFLDHHLRCGNSLIGAWVDEVQKAMEERSKDKQRLLFGTQFAGLLSATEMMRAVGELTDATFDEVQRSFDLYKRADEALAPFKGVLDLWVSHYFGNKGASYFLGKGGDVASLLRTPERLPREDQKLVGEANRIKQAKRFFHWELEFPEVYYEKGGKGADPGFDAVIGNPPYVRIQKQEGEEEKKWLKTFKTTHQNYDIYVPFTERAFSLCNTKGRFCFIIPNKFFQAEYGEKLRGLVTKGHHISQIVNFSDNQIFHGSPATNYTCLFFLSQGRRGEFPYYELPLLSNVEKELPDILGAPSLSPKVKAGILKVDTLGAEPWCFPLGKERAIFEKAKLCGEKLGNVTDQIFQGLITSADHVYILENRGTGPKPGLLQVYSFSQKRELELEASLLKPLISGEDIERYGTPDPHHALLFPYELRVRGGAELIPADKFVKQYPLTWRYLKAHERELRAREDSKFDDKEWYRFGRHQSLDKHERTKFGVPRLVDHLKVMFDPSGEYYLDNVDVNGVLPRSIPSFSPHYLLGVLNSRLLNFLFKKCSVRFRGAFFSANKQFIDPLPVRRINFTTADKERARLLEKAKKLYERCLAKGDQLCVTGFVEHCLAQKPEKADVVHDLLAFLAERMIEMNKKKQVEVKGFLEWLEREIGAKVEELTNKTKIKEYHEGSFEDLLEVFKANRKKLGIDPSRREFSEHLKDEFDRSLAKLRPLKDRLATTDRLIDQIVYRLYGLTEDEIRIVEGS